MLTVMCWISFTQQPCAEDRLSEQNPCALLIPSQEKRINVKLAALKSKIKQKKRAQIHGIGLSWKHKCKSLTSKIATDTPPPTAPLGPLHSYSLNELRKGN